MNEITEELLRRRAGFLGKRRRFLLNRAAVKGSAGTAVQLVKAAAQASPTNTASPINFTITFAGPVTGFTSADVLTTGSTVGGTLTPAVTGGPTTYNIAISGATGNGNVVCSVPAAAAIDATGQPTSASNPATVLLDTTPPSVTINKATGQADPTSSSPILFDVVFSEPVTGFVFSDVTVVFSGGGTPSTTLTPLTGSTYTVSVTGMATPSGNVTASIAAGVCADLAGNANTISTSIDNIVAWTAPVVGTTQSYFFEAGQY
jgi:hypothetical protein